MSNRLWKLPVQMKTWPSNRKRRTDSICIWEWVGPLESGKFGVFARTSPSTCGRSSGFSKPWTHRVMVPSTLRSFRSLWNLRNWSGFGRRRVRGKKLKGLLWFRKPKKTEKQKAKKQKTAKWQKQQKQQENKNCFFEITLISGLLAKSLVLWFLCFFFELWSQETWKDIQPRMQEWFQ